jgi:hypothetical protein
MERRGFLPQRRGLFIGRSIIFMGRRGYFMGMWVKMTHIRGILGRFRGF